MRLEVIKILLSNGSDVNISCTVCFYFNLITLYSYVSSYSFQDGSTPLHRAVSICNVDIVSALLRHGADASIVDKVSLSYIMIFML